MTNSASPANRSTISLFIPTGKLPPRVRLIGPVLSHVPLGSSSFSGALEEARLTCPQLAGFLGPCSSLRGWAPLTLGPPQLWGGVPRPSVYGKRENPRLGVRGSGAGLSYFLETGNMASSSRVTLGEELCPLSFL